MKPEILYEDKYMIAALKPAGVSTQADRGTGVDLETRVQSYLAEENAGQESREEAPYLAAINRLDRPVGGIVLFAKDPGTAAALSDMIQDREIQKYYQAVVNGTFPEPEGELRDWILADRSRNISRVVSAGTKGAKEAALRYEVLDEVDTDEGTMSLVLIQLLTGRHHQIRAQLAAHGVPIWGDLRYNPRFGGGMQQRRGKAPGRGGKKNGKGSGSRAGRKFREIGLYAVKLEFEHPVTGEHVLIHREPEGEAFDLIDQMEF